MDYESLKMHLYDMNEDELFYKKYHYARQQKYSLEEFLAHLDMNDVLNRHLLILERPETLPLKFEDAFFFDLSDNNSIVVQRHNRFSPPLEHSHTFFELLFVYDGKCRQTVSGSEIEMHTGDVCIVPPDIEHILYSTEDSILINIMIRKDTLHTVLYNFLNSQNILSSFFLNNIYAKHANDYIIFHTGSDPALREAFLRMYWEDSNKERYYFQTISSTLILCFYLIIRNYEGSVQMPTFGRRLDVQRYALLEYIQQNYNSVTLASIADKFHYTPEYASRLIKEATNMTYTDIVLRIRMEKAEELLVNTNMSVASIASEVGYETTEHFIRRFKKYAHSTPTAYRQLHSG